MKMSGLVSRFDLSLFLSFSRARFFFVYLLFLVVFEMVAAIFRLVWWSFFVVIPRSYFTRALHRNEPFQLFRSNLCSVCMPFALYYIKIPISNLYNNCYFLGRDQFLLNSVNAVNADSWEIRMCLSLVAIKRWRKSQATGNILLKHRNLCDIA